MLSHYDQDFERSQKSYEDVRTIEEARSQFNSKCQSGRYTLTLETKTRIEYAFNAMIKNAIMRSE